MRLKVLAFAAMLIVTLMDAAKAQDVEGVWLQDDGDNDLYHIKVAKCGQYLCGDIVWMSKPNEGGAPRLDKKNPDPQLRTRKLDGLRIAWDIEMTAPNKWHGQLYSPKRGRTVSLTFSLAGPDTIKARAGPPVIGQNLVLKRVR